jgi:hypothetical protein
VKAECEELRQSLNSSTEMSMYVERMLNDKFERLEKTLEKNKKLTRNVTWAPDEELAEVREF